MREPHVATVLYKVGSGSGISYDNPPPVSFTNSLGSFVIADATLRVTPVEHFSDEESARTAIEPFLRGWEAATDLTRNLGQIRFAYSTCEIIDLNPPAPGEGSTFSIRGSGTVTVTGSATFHLTSREYPAPPEHFSLTSEAAIAYRRWCQYREGKEPLPAMAYFIFTLLKRVTGTLDDAAREFNIHRDVLRKLTQLTSTRGDGADARKAEPGSDFTPLTGEEKAWLDQVTKLIVLRIGERASGGPLSPITLKDLTPLK